MDNNEKALKLHALWKGKIGITTKAPLRTKEDLALAYTPGVAAPCLAIEKDSFLAYTYTAKANLVAVITNGTAVLGLGDIGGMAGMPVMEGKCALFKEFGGVDAFPLCVNSKDVDEFVDTVANIADSFGGINLEDISAPTCFEIERKLKERCDIPVFHDDQHGTAIVTLAAVQNACKVTNKKIEELKIVINGAGAAGVAIMKLLGVAKAKEIIMCDTRGAIFKGRDGISGIKKEIANLSNPNNISGKLAEVIVDADIFIGVSAPNMLTPIMVQRMNKDAIIFAMANPIPEIYPQDALKAGAKVVGTGRSDFPNQINNVLAFPGIFKGALSVLATDINDAMKLAAAQAIASFIPENELRADYIIPSAMDKNVSECVAKAVARAAIDSKINRI